MTITELANPVMPPRAIDARGIVERNGWRLKHYSVVQQGEFDRARFRGLEQVLDQMLPKPATDQLRHGVGFLITHQATAGDYLIAGWWDNVNELPMQTFVSQPGAADFCPSNERQSICIWDVDVVTAERDAFVAAFGEDGLDKETYLNDFRAASASKASHPQMRMAHEKAAR